MSIREMTSLVYNTALSSRGTVPTGKYMVISGANIYSCHFGADVIAEK